MRGIEGHRIRRGVVKKESAEHAPQATARVTGGEVEYGRIIQETVDAVLSCEQYLSVLVCFPWSQKFDPFSLMEVQLGIDCAVRGCT